MKTLTQNFRSALQDWFFLSLLMIFHGFLAFIPETFSQEQILLSRIESLETVYNVRNNAVQFADTSNYFLILKNNRNCIDCFSSLNDFIGRNKKNIPARLVVLALVDSSTLDRKKNFAVNHRIFNQFDSFYFEYKSTSNAENLLIRDQDITPEIILMKKGYYRRIPYSMIFEFPGTEISTRTQNEITEFFK